MREIYLDNSATTRVDPVVADALHRVLTEDYGNPSSLHKKGVDAQLLTDGARKSVAKALGASEQSIYFTSGGTESNNLAIFGAAKARGRLGNKIVTTAFEHSSALEAFKELEARGFEVAYIRPDTDGGIDPADFEAAVDGNTILVSAMLVNSELGSIVPVAEIARRVKRKNPDLLMHCDCVQGFCKIPQATVAGTGADIISISAHKIHGPKGAGALYIKKGARIAPMLYGGSQEGKLRPGTENVPGIYAFGLAARLAMEKREESAALVSEIRSRIVNKLENVDGVRINSGADSSPYILNISVPGIRSEIMLHFLESRGVYVSSGSACSRGARSVTLVSAGLPPEAVDSALRVSFSRMNELDDADAFVGALAEGMGSIRRQAK